jgi:hypothetical protein
MYICSQLCTATQVFIQNSAFLDICLEQLLFLILFKMEAVAVISLVSTVIQTFESLFFFAEQYGRSGPFVWIFGSREIWRVLAQVLRSTNDTDAMDFKKSVQDDSQVIALAVSVYPRPNQSILAKHEQGHHCRSDCHHGTVPR